MGYFDDIKDKLAQTGQTAIQKTKNFSEDTKINQEINDLLKQNEIAFAQIGRIYFEKYSEDNLDAEIGKLLETVNDNNRNLEEKYQKRRNLRGLELCPNCGLEFSSDASFCPGCGSKVEKKQIEYMEQDPDQRVCANCGCLLEEDARFCVKCGHKVEE